MNDFIDGFWQGLIATSFLEWIAVLTGLIYVILAARKSIWCWSFALISSSLYVYICYGLQLYIESFLQVFYVVMAVVGWLLWSRTKNEKLFVKKWPLKFHVLNLMLSTVVTILVGWSFDEWTDQQYPYTDAFTTVFSLVATFMVTKKVLNNWLYWIFVDIVAIFLYMGRDLYLSSVLYLLFTILAIFGWMQWRKQFKLQES